jgi:DNA-binding transcriptional ArsR family regulator
LEPEGVKVIKDPEVAKLLSDETRRKMLDLLRHKEMSATDLVKELDKGYSSIMYHLQLLEEADLVMQVRDEIIQKKVQSFYRATAWSFHVSYYIDETMIDDEEYKAWRENLYNRLLEGLSAYGIEVPPDQKSRAKELVGKLYIKQKKEFEERQEMRESEIQLEPHIGRSIAHILANVRLIKDNEYKKAAEELISILNL